LGRSRSKELLEEVEKDDPCRDEAADRIPGGWDLFSVLDRGQRRFIAQV